MFPVDPANFITPYMLGSAETCVASELVATDPPSVGAQFSWSLGDPFLKSCVKNIFRGPITPTHIRVAETLLLFIMAILLIHLSIRLASASFRPFQPMPMLTWNKR
jgi:hypothetical protein